MEGLIFPNICLCVIFVHFNVLKVHLQHVSKSFTQIITIYFFLKEKNIIKQNYLPFGVLI